MSRLLVRLIAALALVVIPLGPGIVAAPVSAGLSQCYTHGFFPRQSDGRWVAAYSACRSNSFEYHYIQTAVNCSNGGVYYGNRIGPNALDGNGYPYESKAYCPFATYATSWYFRFWF